MDKSQKTKEGYAIKDKIQKTLLKKPMTFSEICKYFNIDSKTMQNYMVALKNQNVVTYHHADMDKYVNFRRYIGVPNRPLFSELIKEQLEMRRLGSINAKLKKKNELEASKNSTAKVTTVTCNDYHTRGSHSKQSAWIGTTFGTMDY